MKQLPFLLCVSIIMYSSCAKNTESHQSVAVTQIIDITNSSSVPPTSKLVVSIFDFNSHIDQEGTYKNVLMTDKALNPIVPVHIEDGSHVDANAATGVANYRKRQIKQFYTDIQKAISSVQNDFADCTSLPSSECYVTLALELERIAATSADRKAILVYSDMMDNNSVNFYDAVVKEMIKNHPEKVAKMLLDKHPLPDDLRNIRVYFIFRPKDKEEDVIFNAIIKMYKLLLEKRGATVIVQADENTNN